MGKEEKPGGRGEGINDWRERNERQIWRAFGLTDCGAVKQMPVGQLGVLGHKPRYLSHHAVDLTACTDN